IMLRGRIYHSGPWGLLKAIPIIGSAAQVRFSGLTALLIGLLIAYSLARTRGPVFILVLVSTIIAITPWRTIAPFPSSPLVATPRFFTTSANQAIPAGSVVMLLPSPAFPRVDGLVWQIRSGMRFDVVGGYSVFRHGKKSSYFAKMPAFANVLIQASNGAQISEAGASRVRSSVAPSGVKFIVITSSATNRANLLQAAERITGCAPQPVSDVILCTVPH
ncbi:MAG: hypothetical protein M3Y42_20280, partial [Actinomycetota bacterium]|nr:hypothetical protein [Actinomycetota bacterium]